MNTPKAIVPFFIGSPDIVHWRQGPTPAARDPDTSPRIHTSSARHGRRRSASSPPALPASPPATPLPFVGRENADDVRRRLQQIRRHLQRHQALVVRRL